MGSSPSAPQPPRFAAKSVVVIGGGLCGAAVASALDKDFAVTLVDNKPYCELTPCAIDVCLQPTKEALEARARAIRVPHKVYVKRGKVVLGRVMSLSDDGHVVRTDTGEEIKADYVVIATGSSNTIPWKVPSEQTRDPKQRSAEFLEWGERVRQAKEILIVGMGPVGVEFAAEILARFPDKKLHLVSHSERMLPRAKPALGAKAQAHIMTYPNVKLYLGESVQRENEEKGAEGHGGVFITTKTQQRLAVDLALFTTGLQPQTAFLRPNHAARLDDKGFVKVNDYLEVEGLPGVFAAGDCINWKVERTAAHAQEEAKTLAEHIVALQSGQRVSRTSLSSLMAVSLGPDHGVMDLGVMTILGFGDRGSSLAAGLKVKSQPYMTAPLAPDAEIAAAQGQD